MSQVDDETAVRAVGDGTYATRLHAAWNIGANANGGYAMLPALRAVTELAGHPDPLSVTVHYLRPAAGDVDGEVSAHVGRVGRATTNVTATLAQEGKERLSMVAVLGDLSTGAGRTVTAGTTADLGVTLAPPDLPPPDACIDRAELMQGVELPILSRVEVRLRPEMLRPDPAAPAVVEGWIRFADGAPPEARWLPLFADAFPPALNARIGRTGWVPTIELTVQVRRRPVAGWVRARFECDDVDGGRMIESGTLWDASDAVVARSRQLGLLLAR
ncbi:MAG: thioesterase family protein [Ilumatobacteraceae bacterium]